MARSGSGTPTGSALPVTRMLSGQEDGNESSKNAQPLALPKLQIRARSRDMRCGLGYQRYDALWRFTARPRYNRRATRASLLLTRAKTLMQTDPAHIINRQPDAVMKLKQSERLQFEEPVSVLNLEALPLLPQLAALAVTAPTLWERLEVVALWIGGSIARGNADIYSDVDLRIAVTPEALEMWRHIDLNTLFADNCVAHMLLPFGERAFLHHLVLASGDIYDVWVQSVEEAVHDEFTLTLACRNEDFAAKLREPDCKPLPPPLPAEAETVRMLVEGFWLNTHKHRKVLHRGLHLLSLTGIHLERQLLLRLWHIQATGNDCGEMRTQTIHGLTHLMQTVEQARGSEALEALGASLATRADIFRAVEQLRDQVTQAGRMLAQALGFDYPEAMEETARRGWQEFLRRCAAE